VVFSPPNTAECRQEFLISLPLETLPPCFTFSSLLCPTSYGESTPVKRIGVTWSGPTAFALDVHCYRCEGAKQSNPLPKQGLYLPITPPPPLHSFKLGPVFLLVPNLNTQVYFSPFILGLLYRIRVSCFFSVSKLKKLLREKSCPGDLFFSDFKDKTVGNVFFRKWR